MIKPLTDLINKAFGIHRSSFKYWLQRDKRTPLKEVELIAEIRKANSESQGSAGARTIADIVSKRGFPLSRYRADNFMKKLNLVSCQQPKHAYKRASKEYLAIPVLSQS